MEKKSTPHKPSRFINRLAWIAFAISLTALVSWTVSFIYGYGGPRIATMKAVRLVHLFGAILGTVLGIVCVLLLVMRRRYYSADMARAFLAVLLGVMGVRGITGFWHTAFGRVEAASRAVCATRLKGIDTAMYMYGTDHKLKYPPKANWQQILIEEGHISENVFICPSVGPDPKRESSYIYRGPASFSIPGNWVVLYERQNNHSLRPFGRHVAMGDHGVQFVAEEEFQELIRKENAERQKAGLSPFPAED